MLPLPPKTTDACFAPGFQDRNHNGRAAHSVGLFAANRKQGAVGYGFHETGSKCIGRYAERLGVIFVGNLFHDIGVGCARVDKRATQRFKELAVFGASGSKLRHLARAAGYNVLMAFSTTLRVVCRAKAVSNFFKLFEYKPVIVE
jgi:hypothetical protein